MSAEDGRIIFRNETGWRTADLERIVRLVLSEATPVWWEARFPDVVEVRTAGYGANNHPAYLLQHVNHSGHFDDNLIRVEAEQATITSFSGWRLFLPAAKIDAHALIASLRDHLKVVPDFRVRVTTTRKLGPLRFAIQSKRKKRRVNHRKKVTQQIKERGF